MLQIRIPDSPDIEVFNNKTCEFEIVKGRKGAVVQLEHSLISVSKWESKWKKSFLNTAQKSVEETIDYVRCMTIGTAPDPEVYKNLTEKDLRDIHEYINDSMTATWFKEDKVKAPSRKIITSERIYSWMVDCEIPFSCEKWHLNRLLTLIRVRHADMNGKDGNHKMRRKDMLAQNRALNASRRAKMGSKG